MLFFIHHLIRSEGEGHPPLLEVDPRVGKKVDFCNIVPPEAGGSQTAPSNSAIEGQSKEEFVDDPDVPPLEEFVDDPDVPPLEEFVDDPDVPPLV